jgi:hypothetical protein
VLDNDLKKSGAAFKWQKMFWTRSLIFRTWSINRPENAKDDGDALILVRPDQ